MVPLYLIQVRQAGLEPATYGWQDHYAAFSFSRSHRARVIAYIRNQKRHHATGTIWTPWERVEEPSPPGSAG